MVLAFFYFQAENFKRPDYMVHPLNRMQIDFRFLNWSELVVITTPKRLLSRNP